MDGNSPQAIPKREPAPVPELHLVAPKHNDDEEVDEEDDQPKSLTREEIEEGLRTKRTAAYMKYFDDIVKEGRDTVASVENYVRAVETKHGKKRLFVCCDGTWKNAQGTIAPQTNVARLARCVDRFSQDPMDRDDDGGDDDNDEGAAVSLVPQIVYYHAGVGSQPVIWGDGQWAGATGQGLDANVLNAYCFLSNNFNFSSRKDEIILVGFSRGAFTVRCLAAFVSAAGLLRKKYLPLLPEVFEDWCRRGDGSVDAKWREAKVSFPAIITVLGEWDAVSAMGGSRSFAFVKDEVPNAVQHAFSAVSLDERRGSFLPMLWYRQAVRSNSGNDDDSSWTSPRDRTVKQCLFRGCHGDVGGGNADAGLSNTSLLWMIAQIRYATWAAFDTEALHQTVYPLPRPRPRPFPEAAWWKSWLRWWRRGEKPEESKINLKALMMSEGKLHESLKGKWAIPYYLSLTLFNGKRDALFRNFSKKADADMSSTLKVHFTVRLFEEPGSPAGTVWKRTLQSWKIPYDPPIWLERRSWERWREEVAQWMPAPGADHQDGEMRRWAKAVDALGMEFSSAAAAANQTEAETETVVMVLRVLKAMRDTKPAWYPAFCGQEKPPGDEEEERYQNAWVNDEDQRG